MALGDEISKKMESAIKAIEGNDKGAVYALNTAAAALEKIQTVTISTFIGKRHKPLRHKVLTAICGVKY